MNGEKDFGTHKTTLISSLLRYQIINTNELRTENTIKFKKHWIFIIDNCNSSSNKLLNWNYQEKNNNQ